MSVWTSSILSVLLLQTVQLQGQQVNEDSKPTVVEEAAPASEEPPRPLVFAKRDWVLTQAYFDVFKILSHQNTCSNFYGGPRAATTVLNDFATLVRSAPLGEEVPFQMAGKLRVVHNTSTRVSYRLFERTMVNTNGSFYQRRTDVMRRFPYDIGDFAAGSRPARALILLHELGHLIEGEDGAWLLPNDGFNGPQSKANTLRVQQACRKQLDSLK